MSATTTELRTRSPSHPADDAQPARRRYLRLVIPLAVLLTAAGFVAWRFEQVPAEGPAELTLQGNIDVRQVNLSFKVDGRIDSLAFDEGDFAGAYGLAGARRREAVERLTGALGLGSYLAVNSGELPLGFKQRLALACAVLHDPPVLFLDEPTSGVDPLTRREFWSHINAVVERGVTVLVTTHFLDEAEYCDRIGLVCNGRVIAEGSPDDLKDRVRSADHPEPTLEGVFIALVEASDAERGEP